MSFLRIAIYLSIAMIVFNLIIGFVGGLDAFPIETIPGTGTIEEGNALSTFTGLSGGMENVWLLVTTITGIGAILLAIATRTLMPVGLYLFGEIFWTAYIRSNSVLSVGGFISSDFLSIFFVCMLFLFLAAIVGILTGGD